MTQQSERAAMTQEVRGARRARHAFALLCGVTLAFAACGGSSSAAEKTSTKAEAPSSASRATAVAAKTVTKATASLAPKGSSGVTGNAVLEQGAGTVAYRVEVSGAPAGSHALYIMQDPACGGGNRTGPLAAVETGPDGAGAGEGTVTTQLSVLVGQALGIFAGGTSSSDIVACGKIEASE